MAPCRHNWRWWALAFDVALLLVAASVSLRVLRPAVSSYARVSRITGAGWTTVALHAAQAAVAAVGLAQGYIHGAADRLADDGFRIAFGFIMAALLAVTSGRRDSLSPASIACYIVALVAGVPRLAAAVAVGTRYEYINVLVFYITILCTLVLALVPGRVPAGKRRINVAGTYWARVVFDASRLAGVCLIAARLEGSSPVGGWTWNRVFLPLWTADALGGALSLQWLLTQRAVGVSTAGHASAADAMSAYPGLASTVRSWLWQAHVSPLVYTLTAGGAGGAAFKVMLALSLDGRRDILPWVLASPLLAQVLLCASVWLFLTCSQYAAAPFRCGPSLFLFLASLLLFACCGSSPVAPGIVLAGTVRVIVL